MGVILEFHPFMSTPRSYHHGSVASLAGVQHPQHRDAAGTLGGGGDDIALGTAEATAAVCTAAATAAAATRGTNGAATTATVRHRPNAT